MSEEIKKPSGELTQSDWDNLEKPEVIEEIKSPEEEAREQVEFWAGEYRFTEAAFSRRKNKKLSYEEFQKWESDAGYNYKRLKESEPYAGYKDRYERDRSERISTTPGDSIEAYAGEFYLRRNRALLSAIESSESETAKTDNDIVTSFYSSVAEHIYYKYDHEDRSFDPMRYQMNRRDAHNRMINHLNAINGLCERYGVERFTLRNFETNDFVYDRDKDPMGYTDQRADCDRTIVEEYVTRAFSSDFEKAERDAKKGWY